MTARLHQINVSYNPVQDRLLLRISTSDAQEYRMWLTRRYAAMLTGVLNKEMDNRGGAPAVASSEETTRQIKEGALEKKFDAEQASTYPLGEQGVLAFRINAKNTDKEVMILELLPEKGKGITLNLTHSLMYMFHNVLSQGIAQANWGLQPESSPSSQVH